MRKCKCEERKVFDDFFSHTCNSILIPGFLIRIRVPDLESGFRSGNSNEEIHTEAEPRVNSSSYMHI
jgi:hypothetical protein